MIALAVCIVVFALSLLLMLLWHAAYGYCHGCKQQREPRCDCRDKNTRVRRPRFKW